MTILGVGSITLLPIGLELGCELTRNADGSSAILWFWYVENVRRHFTNIDPPNSGNGLGIIFLLGMLITPHDPISLVNPGFF